MQQKLNFANPDQAHEVHILNLKTRHALLIKINTSGPGKFKNSGSACGRASLQASSAQFINSPGQFINNSGWFKSSGWLKNSSGWSINSSRTKPLQGDPSIFCERQRAAAPVSPKQSVTWAITWKSRFQVCGYGGIGLAQGVGFWAVFEGLASGFASVSTWATLPPACAQVLEHDCHCPRHVRVCVCVCLCAPHAVLRFW